MSYSIQTESHGGVMVMLLLISIWNFAPAEAAQDKTERPRPNVVLVMTDDQGYGDLSCHGNPVLQTPHLDGLYRESVRLTNFHVDPTCSPTRAALMTGRYSTRTGVWHTVMGRHMPRPCEIMMPRVFADSGYRTAIFGKWHLGDNFPFRPQDRGFQEVLIHGGGGVGQIPDYWGNDYFGDTYFENDRPRKFAGYCTDIFFRQAIEFIEANRDRPFFVYLPTNAPHAPFYVARQYSEPYREKVGGNLERSKFYGMIANIDENVGKLLARLEEWGLADNTIVIFMTDNGTSGGATFTNYRGNKGELLSGFNAGMRGRKGSPYEGGHRVPFFLRWPAGGLAGGRDAGQLAAHIDLLPTLIELCRLKPPAAPRFDGMSFARLLRNEASDWPDRTLFAHHQELPRPVKYRFGSVMRNRWRLITRNDDGKSDGDVGIAPTPRFELYDIATDPAQRLDVSRQHPNIVRQLRSAYDEWWKDLATRFDEDSRIIVGDERQNPTRLTCFEWHGSRHWWQNDVRSGFEDKGYWAIDIARPGTYAMTLRRWPEEVDAPITAGIDGGKAINAVEAKLRIGNMERKQPIAAGATSVRFEVRLPSGKSQMETWLIDEDGRSRGAYYVTAERLMTTLPNRGRD